MIFRKVVHEASAARVCVCVLRAWLHRSQRSFASLDRKYLKSPNMEAQAKSRDDPIIKKIDSPEFKALFNEELVTLKNIFDKYNYEIRIAGGPVRDLLMGIQPKDIDLASTATPSQMKEMFEKENVRMLNTNGEKHGTVTARINDRENFEVTTLRIDVATDGRHALVEYTTDWKLDASRRDLTINSMFLDFDGNVYDYFYGYEDLAARKISFVGRPESRITEDYLRILRYFRFYGRIAEKPYGHDEATLKAIADNSSGLERISGERIWQELKKILAGNFAGDLMRTMLELGMGKYLGLPEKINAAELKRVWNDCGDLNLHPVTLLVSTLGEPTDVVTLNSRLKMSCYDRELAYFLSEKRDLEFPSDSIKPFQKMYFNTKFKTSVEREYIIELLKYKNWREKLKLFEEWSPPKFPIGGAAVCDLVTNRKQVAAVLQRLRDEWVDSDFELSPDEMVKSVPEIVRQLPRKEKPSPVKKKQMKMV